MSKATFWQGWWMALALIWGVIALTYIITGDKVMSMLFLIVSILASIKSDTV